VSDERLRTSAGPDFVVANHLEEIAVNLDKSRLALL
jgi:hypothetical protein